MPPKRNLRSHDTRLTRSSNSPPARSAATIQHTSNTAQPSIRLTVKAPPSKLRQAISGSDLPPNTYADGADSETPDPPPRPSRATRNPRTVVEPDSDEDEEMHDDAGEGDDAEGDDMDDDMAEDSEDDEDAEGDDLDMDEPHPPPPIISALPTTKTKGKQKANIAVAAPPTSNSLKSVGAKEVEEEEDLSDLEDDEELDDEGLGEDEDEENEDSELDDEEGGTRDGTPDLSKLTRRQQAAYSNNAAEEEGLMALSNEAQKKKHLTAEEISMRRAEMARRRKNLSEKRNEEEKVCG